MKEKMGINEMPEDIMKSNLEARVLDNDELKEVSGGKHKYMVGIYNAKGVLTSYTHMEVTSADLEDYHRFRRRWAELQKSIDDQSGVIRPYGWYDIAPINTDGRSIGMRAFLDDFGIF